MTDITANVSFSNISVTNTPSNITVTDASNANNVVNVTTTDSTITVNSTNTNVTVANVATISNVILRQALSAVDAGGDGSFSYNNVSGVFTYTGPSPSEVRSHFSVTDTGGDGSLTYSNSTGIFTFTGPSALETREKINVVNEPANVLVEVIQFNGSLSPTTILLQELPKEWANGTYISFANSTNPALANINGTTKQVGNISPGSSTVTLYTSWPSTPFNAGHANISAGAGLTAEYSQTAKGNVSYSTANGNISYRGVTLDDIIDIVNFPGSKTESGQPSIPNAISPLQWFGYGNADSDSEFTNTVTNAFGETKYEKGDLIFESRFVPIYNVNNILYKESDGNDGSMLVDAGSFKGWPNSAGSSGTDKILDLEGFQQISGVDSDVPLGAVVGHGTITDDIQRIDPPNALRAGKMNEYTITMVQDSTGGHNFTSNINIGGNVSQDVANGFIKFMGGINSLNTDPGAFNLVTIKEVYNITDGTTTTDQRGGAPKYIIDISSTTDIGGLTNAQAQAFIQDNGLNGSGNVTMTGVASFGNSATQTHNFTGNVNVTGNIEVAGNLNYRNVEDLFVRDQSITLNANATTDATSSIIINRPQAGANTVLRWNETDDKWQFSNDGSAYKDLVGNADVVAHINGNGLDFTTSISTLADIDFNNAGSQGLNFKEQGKIRITSGSAAGNISPSHGPINSTLPAKMNYYSLKDASSTLIEPEFEKGVEIYLDSNAGIKHVYAKGRGSIASPAGPNTGDRVFDEYFMHHNGTDYKARFSQGQAGRFVFYDQSVASFDANTMPLTQEFFAWNNGDLTTGNAKSLLRLAPDGTISFNGDGTTSSFTSALANITSDGSFNSNSNITAVGNISGNYILGNGSLLTGISTSGVSNAQAQAFIQENGLTMTNTITSNGLISTTGNLQINADTPINGLKGLTFDNTNNFLGLGTTTPGTLLDGTSEDSAIHIQCLDQFHGTLTIEEARGTTSGPEINFFKAWETANVLQAVASGNRIGEIHYEGHDGTNYHEGLSTQVFVDGTVSSGTVPMGWEVRGSGDGTAVNKSMFKVRGNGALQVGIMNTDDSDSGTTFQVQADGNVSTTGKIDATGVITGGTLTDGTLSSTGGAVTGATSITSTTFTDGALTITGGNISTATNIGATGTIDTNGLIKTFGGNIEAAAGNIVGVHLHGEGSNITGIPSLTSFSVTTNSPSGNGALSYNNTSGVFSFTPADASGGGISNAQAQAFIQENGLTMTSLISSNANITTTANINTGGATLTGVLSSTGNVQINSETDVSGLSGLTFDTSTNNLGLGTTTPGAALHIRGTSNESQIFMTEFNSGSSAGVDIRTFRAAGTEGSPDFVTNNKRLFSRFHNAYDSGGSQSDGETSTFSTAFAEQVLTDATHSANSVPVNWQLYHYRDGDTSNNPTAFIKARANGDIEFATPIGSAFDQDALPAIIIDKDGVYTSNANITTTANVNAGGGTLTGAVTSNSNITTTANVSGGFILGNGSQLTGIAASYGNAEVTAFLDSDTMTGNIEYTGNLLVGAPVANVNVSVQGYFGNVNTGSQDQFQPSSNLDVVNGAAVSFHSQAGGTPLTFLNGNVYYVTSVGGGVWNLFEDAGLTTQLKTGLNNESGNINGLTVEYVGQGTSRANIEGSVFVTNSVEAEDDVKAGNALFGDRLFPFTGGGTIGFTGARMSDVGLGGGAGNDFFWPETGRPDPGSLLIAGTGGAGYWSQGVVIENQTLNAPIFANVTSSTATNEGIETEFRRSRGNTSAPTSIGDHVGAVVADQIYRANISGHDGTAYRNTFWEEYFTDSNTSIGGIANVSNGVMPIGKQIMVHENGAVGSNSGFGFPIVKYRPDRSIEFNSPVPVLGIGLNQQGNANILADGSFNSNANITSVANINAAGATFTGNVTSNSLIRTTGNLQVNADVDAGQGLLGLTFDTSTNRLGLGTQTPETTIDIVCDDDNEADIMMTEYDGGSGGPDFIMRKANNNKTTPTVLDTGDRLGMFKYQYWLHDNPSNPDDGTGDFGFDAITHEVFADGNHGVNDTLSVASYDGSTNPDEIVLSDASYSVGDGSQFLITGTTNANLTSLNNTIVFVDRTGGSSSRVYKLYSDSGLTTPINLGTGSEAPSGMQISTPSTKQPVGVSLLQTVATSDGTFVQNATKLRANATIEIGANSDRDTDGAAASITKEGLFTTSANIVTSANVIIGDRLKLKNYTTTEINALTGLAAGDVVFNTTLNLVCVYNGTGWRKLNDAAM